MTVSESAVHSAAFPAVRSARVTLTLADGRIQSAETTTSEGATDNPLTDPRSPRSSADSPIPCSSVAAANWIEAAVAGRPRPVISLGA